MGRVVGGVDINNKFLATGQGSYITIHPGMAEVKNALLAQAVLKPGQGRLWGQLPVQDVFKEGIVFQMRYIIGIFIALH